MLINREIMECNFIEITTSLTQDLEEKSDYNDRKETEKRNFDESNAERG